MQEHTAETEGVTESCQRESYLIEIYFFRS